MRDMGGKRAWRWIKKGWLWCGGAAKVDDKGMIVFLHWNKESTFSFVPTLKIGRRGTITVYLDICYGREASAEGPKPSEGNMAITEC